MLSLSLPTIHWGRLFGFPYYNCIPLLCCYPPLYSSEGNIGGFFSFSGLIHLLFSMPFGVSFVAPICVHVAGPFLSFTMAFFHHVAFFHKSCKAFCLGGSSLLLCDFSACIVCNTACPWACSSPGCCEADMVSWAPFWGEGEPGDLVLHVLMPYILLFDVADKSLCATVLLRVIFSPIGLALDIGCLKESQEGGRDEVMITFKKALKKCRAVSN
jgi:hypothetical protein